MTRNNKTRLYLILILAISIIGIMIGVYAGQSSHNFTEINNTKEINTTKDLKFITVGDPQINSTTFEGIERLKQVVNFINKSDVDFAVFEGDMTDDGTNKSNDIVKDILKDLKKPYYVVIGNHDIYLSTKVFESYYGPMEHIEHVNGYQLLFIGMTDRKNENGDTIGLNWSFDFNKADKNEPTLVFIHGPVRNIPIGCLYCRLLKNILGYGFSIRPELEKFTNLVGVYSGHVHYDSNRMVNGTRYVTVNGLIDITIDKIPITYASNKVGYSTIKGNYSYFELVPFI